MYRFRYFLNRNNKTDGKKNIHEHYDLGNAFYRLWLDPSMTYSSAWFQADSNTNLELAQRAKYRNILKEADLAGHRITGLTLSTEQQSFAMDRINQQSPNRLEVRLQDDWDCKD